MADQKNEFVIIGQVYGPWGVKGRLKVNVMTDFPDRFKAGETVYIEGQPCVIEKTEWHKGNALVQLKGVDSIDRAEELTGKYLEISPAQIKPLPEGQYYHYQIAGLRVVTTDGKELGTVEDIMTSTANDIYVVRGKEGEVLIPATADIIKSIDLEKKRMVVEAIPGLLDLNRKGPEEPPARRRFRK